MKSLIVVAGYGIKNHNKRVEVELLNKLQPIRNEYDILYISHTHANELIQDLIDYSIYDSKNSLIYDFNYKPMFWWANENFTIETTEIYRFATHNAIFRMMSMASNFSKFIGYEKLHYMEYDILLNNLDIIKNVDTSLNSNDCVVFTKNNEWIFGCYIAFKPNKYDFLDKFDEQIFKSFLKNTNNNFTEKTLHSLFLKDHKHFSFSFEENFNNLGQQIHSLGVKSKIMWSIPVYNNKTNMFEFFINVTDEIESIIKVIINDTKLFTFNIKKTDLNRWFVSPLDDLNKVHKIEVYQNQELDYVIDFNETNKLEFIKKNVIISKK